MVRSVAYVEFWCGNAKIMANYWCKTLGFHPIAIKGLKSGDKSKTSIVVAQGNTRCVLTTASSPKDTKFYDFLACHGDAVKDVALNVDNVEEIFNQAVQHGAIPLVQPHKLQDDHGIVSYAQIGTPFGDLVHTLIDSSKYSGPFMPGFVSSDEPASNKDFGIDRIDHIALAYNKGETKNAMDWYRDCLGFEHFLCNDEDPQEGLSILATDDMEGGLKTIVAACAPDKYSFKFVLVEAIEGSSKNQVEEFVEYNGGAGVQHIALLAKDILESVDNLKKNGLDFLQVPATYYNTIFPSADSSLNKHRSKIEELGLLVEARQTTDGSTTCLTQTFTMPIFDRPTFFLEVIQRKGASGFGKRTIKALFEAVEKQRRNRDSVREPTF